MEEKTFHEIEREAWTARAAYYDDLFAPITRQAIGDILDSLDLLAGFRHLDLACGTGHLVVSAAQRGASSEGIDFAQAMIDVARANYPSENFQVADAMQLPYRACTFDSLTCAFGLSHMADAQAAVNEAFRVLKPGGKFAFTLWYGPDDGGEWMAIVKTAMARYATTAFTIPYEGKTLRLADKQACAIVTEKAGFARPVFKSLPTEWRASSAQDMLDFLDKLSVRTKLAVDAQPPGVRMRIHEYILEEVGKRRTNGIISLATPTLLTVVQKPRSMRLT